MAYSLKLKGTNIHLFNACFKYTKYVMEDVGKAQFPRLWDLFGEGHSLLPVSHNREMSLLIGKMVLMTK